MWGRQRALLSVLQLDLATVGGRRECQTVMRAVGGPPGAPEAMWEPSPALTRITGGCHHPSFAAPLTPLLRRGDENHAE